MKKNSIKKYQQPNFKIKKIKSSILFYDAQDLLAGVHCCSDYCGHSVCDSCGDSPPCVN